MEMGRRRMVQGIRIHLVKKIPTAAATQGDGNEMTPSVPHLPMKEGPIVIIKIYQGNYGDRK